MEEYARIAGLDFVTQSVCNGHRKIIRLWSGDLREAFRKGVPEAAKLYETQPVKDADVVIANGYPYAIEEWGKFDWANWSLRQGGNSYHHLSDAPGTSSHALLGRAKRLQKEILLGFDERR